MVQKTVSGNFNLNAMPRTYLHHRQSYGNAEIPTVSNYFRFAGAFSEYAKSQPYKQSPRFFVRSMKGPNLLTATEGTIPL